MLIAYDIMAQVLNLRETKRSVAENEVNFTTKEVKQARAARELQTKFGNPTDSTLCEALL